MGRITKHRHYFKVSALPVQMAPTNFPLAFRLRASVFHFGAVQRDHGEFLCTCPGNSGEWLADWHSGHQSRKVLRLRHSEDDSLALHRSLRVRTVRFERPLLSGLELCASPTSAYENAHS